MNSVITLAAAQVFAASGLTVVVLMGGIASARIAPSPAWATAPISIAIVAMALTTIPASMLMQRVGRRTGFFMGALLGVGGGAVAALGIAMENFPVFCGGAVLLGATMAFTQQYRFAAAESVAPELVSRALSYVLIGSLCAAILGPQVALAARDWIANAPYAGSFLATSALYAVAIAVLTRFKPAARPEVRIRSASERSFDLSADARFRTAVCASVAAYVVMSFIMTAAPVNMHVMDHHNVETTTWVIQSHVLAMYAPALISGRIVEWFGERAVMISGAVLMIACVAVNASGHQAAHYWWGLVLLGVGWNLLFLSGTTLLTRSVPAASRYRAQAINDFTVFGSQACASLLAGLAVQTLGWRLLNLATLPFLAVMLVLALRLRAAPAVVPVTSEA